MSKKAQPETGENETCNRYKTPHPSGKKGANATNNRGCTWGEEEEKSMVPRGSNSPVAVVTINLLSKQSDYSLEEVANSTANVGELSQTSLVAWYLSYEVLYLIVAPK